MIPLWLDLIAKLFLTSVFIAVIWGWRPERWVRVLLTLNIISWLLMVLVFKIDLAGDA